MELGRKIKARRELKGLTLEQVGNFVGVTKSTVRKWETGAIKNMGRDKISKLAEILDVSHAYLVGDVSFSFMQSEKLVLKLREVRLSNDLTQKELANILNEIVLTDMDSIIYPQTVSNWEKRSIPSVEALKKMSIALGLSADYLLGIEASETEKDKKIIGLQEENKMLKEMLQKYSALITQLTELKEK